MNAMLMKFSCICRGPYVFESYGVGVIIYESLLTVFVISNFGLATFMDPGIYPQGMLIALPIAVCLFTVMLSVSVVGKWWSISRFFCDSVK